MLRGMLVAGVDSSANQISRGQNRPSGAPWPAGVLNLLVPGLGIICVGRTWPGVILGLIFAAFANLALWAVLLMPDDLPAWGPPLAVGLAAGAYVGCQIDFVRSSRDRRRREQDAIRHSALAAVSEALARGDFVAGLDALGSISHLAAQDLLVAYRQAQVLTGLGDEHAAYVAWRQVRTLDRHNIYRDEWRTAVGGALNSTDAAGDVPSTGFLI